MTYGIRFDSVRKRVPRAWFRHDYLFPGDEYPPGRNINQICDDLAYEKRLLEIMNNAKETRKLTGL